MRQALRACSSRIGACATAGGIQALRNCARRPRVRRRRLRHARVHQTLDTSTPIAEHVPVDFELRGCPINKQQLLEVVCGVPGRPQAQPPEPQRLRRVQAARAASA